MSEDRLRRAEILLETAAKYINRHDEAIARQEEAIARHEEAIARYEETNTQLNLRMLQLVDMFSELAAITRQNQEQFNRQQQEIQRIWEYLMSQSGNGRSGTENS